MWHLDPYCQRKTHDSYAGKPVNGTHGILLPWGGDKLCSSSRFWPCKIYEMFQFSIPANGSYGKSCCFHAHTWALQKYLTSVNAGLYGQPFRSNRAQLLTFEASCRRPLPPKDPTIVPNNFFPFY